jgi:hypothetical protein
MSSLGSHIENYVNRKSLEPISDLQWGTKMTLPKTLLNTVLQWTSHFRCDILSKMFSTKNTHHKAKQGKKKKKTRNIRKKWQVAVLHI